MITLGCTDCVGVSTRSCYLGLCMCISTKCTGPTNALVSSMTKLAPQMERHFLGNHIVAYSLERAEHCIVNTQHHKLQSKSDGGGS